MGIPGCQLSGPAQNSGKSTLIGKTCWPVCKVPSRARKRRPRVLLCVFKTRQARCKSMRMCLPVACGEDLLWHPTDNKLRCQKKLAGFACNGAGQAPAADEDHTHGQVL